MNVIPIIRGVRYIWIEQNRTAMTTIPIISVASFQRAPKTIECFLEAIKESYLIYYASDLISELGYSELSELDAGLERAVAICETAEIPVEENIKMIYRDNHSQLFKDWKLSRLSRYLLMVNGRPTNRTVAQTQINLYYDSNKRHKPYQNEKSKASKQ